MRAVWGRAAALALLIAAAGLPTAALAAVPDPPPTVVTLMFDDGWKGQDAAADVLSAHDMRGTFFVNSGMWTFPDYMSRREVARVAAQGHEIGGHTLTHPRLTALTASQRRHEVCQDRANLLALRTTVTSFAYPYGRHDAATARVVEGCGYSSARIGDGLADRPPQDLLCDCVARLPFDGDRWDVPVKPMSLGPTNVHRLERWVRQAERVGGWVPIVIERVCDQCAPGSISLPELSEFVEWLADRPGSTRVETYRDALASGLSRGAASRLDVTHALPPAQQEPASSGASPSGVSSAGEPARKDYAVVVGGQGIGQAQIVGAFVIAAMTASIVFRVASRRRQGLRLRHTS